MPAPGRSARTGARHAHAARAGDRHQHAQPQAHGDHGGAAVADEGQRHAHHRQDAADHAHVDEDVGEQAERDRPGQQPREHRRRLGRDHQPAEQQEGEQQADHCGVDADFLVHPHVPIPAAPRLVCIGRLSEQKGHLLLIEAASKLAVTGLDFKLVFVGDGPLRSEIEQQIAQLKLQNNIEITGWASSDEVREQLLASRAMVLPSFAEGLPVVIMESLALNRPVISTYVAGIPELVEPGVCGWLVPPGSAEILAVAMRAALEAPLEKLEEMGKAGAQRVAQQHNVDLEAKKLVALFQASIEQKS